MSEHISKVSSGMYMIQAGKHSPPGMVFLSFFPQLILAEIYLYCLSDCHSVSHGKRGGFGHCKKNSVVCNRGKKAEPGPSLSGIVNQIKIPKLL